MRQHRDHYQHHHQHQQQHLQSQTQQHLQQSREKLLFKKHTKVHHFEETILHTKINSIQYTLERNLSDNTAVGDLYEFFGLRSTQYQMPLFESTGKQTGFTYITVPEHVVKELVILHDIEFNGRKLVTEKAKTPPKTTTGKKKLFCKCNRF